MRRLVLIMLLTLSILPALAQRRVSPVNTAAAMTQSVNETATDTARINEKRRLNSISYVDDRGITMYLDTITNTEWTDSTVMKRVPPMQYPLWHALSVGLDVWDPLMRVFGQEHGLVGAWAELSLHNRYKPVVEMGLGLASHRGPTDNFLYRSPLSVYFKIGANYNFLFNSNPDYQLYAGLRYGFSPFSYHVDDITLKGSYWDEASTFSIPSRHVSAGWMEFGIGLRVKIWGPVSAGWMFKFRSILHQSNDPYGKPWYIPGYGTRGSKIAGSISIVYTISLRHLNKEPDQAVINEQNQ